VTIRIKRGLDVPISGAPVQSIEPGPVIGSVAVLGADYVGLRPRLLVRAGDDVIAGQPILSDRDNPDVVVTAPAGGRVTAVNRGARRALESVVIEIDEERPEATWIDRFRPSSPGGLDRDFVAGRLLESGMWTSFRTRPYSRVPSTGDVPEAIFVTATDTRPHAPDPDVVISEDTTAFEAGLDVVHHLTDGIVHVCCGANSSIRVTGHERRRQHRFAGPHPAGLPGTHIHLLHPAGFDCSVWHIGYQDVIAIGRLFATGRLDVSRVIALAGPGLDRPRLVRTRLGAATDELVGPADGCRVVSGSLLDGRAAAGTVAFLGRYHQQVSVIPEAGDRGLFAWLYRDGRVTTARHGRSCPMIPREDFDAVMPLDLLANPLLRSLLVGDTHEAARLGCLELDEEDLALIAWLCPAKIDYGSALRSSLDAIWRER